MKCWVNLETDRELKPVWVKGEILVKEDLSKTFPRVFYRVKFKDTRNYLDNTSKIPKVELISEEYISFEKPKELKTKVPKEVKKARPLKIAVLVTVVVIYLMFFAFMSESFTANLTDKQDAIFHMFATFVLWSVTATAFLAIDKKVEAEIMLEEIKEVQKNLVDTIQEVVDILK